MTFTMQYSEEKILDVVLEVKNILEVFLDDTKNNLNKNKIIFLGLKGDLGAGKTTLTKSLLKNYGVEKTVASPTFVIRRDYICRDTFDKIIHIDAYRLENKKDIKNILRDINLMDAKENILILIEWPENADIKYDIIFEIKHISETERQITQILE